MLANVIITYFKAVNGNDLFYQENEVIENLQAALLAISGLVFLIYSFFSEKHSSLILLSLSLLCLSFFLREVDVEDYDLPPFLIFIGGDIGRNIMLLILWVVIAFFMARNFYPMKKIITLYLLSNAGLLILICANLLFAGDFLERWFEEVGNSEFLEELLEFNAYYLLFWSSLISRTTLLRANKSLSTAHS